MADIRIDIKANDDASKKLGDVSKAMEGLEKETQKTGKTAQQTADQVTRLGGDFSSLGSNLDALINKYRSSTPENLKFAASIEKINREFDDGKISSQEAAKQLEAVKKAMGDTGGETKKATGIMQGFSGAMIGINQALELAGKGARAFQAAFDFARQGAVLNQTTESFERMAASLGPNINLLDELRAASRNTVDDLTLMSSVLTLTAGTSKELGDAMLQSSPRLMEIAKAASALNPTLGDTAWMFESINSGIKRNSPLILDNLGIVVRVGEANEKYAESLGKTVAELTAAETQQALLNEVLEAGGRLIDQAGGSAESALDPFDEFTTTVKNLTAELQKLAETGGAPVIRELNKLANVYLELANATNIYNRAVKLGLIDNNEKNRLIREGYTQGWDLEDITYRVTEAERRQAAGAKALAGDYVYMEGAVQHVISANGEYTYTVGEAAVATEQMAEAIIYAVPNMSAMENAIYTSSYNAGVLRDNISEMVNSLYAGGSAADEFASKFNNATYNIAIGREELDTIGETAEALFAAGAIDQGTFLDATALLGAAAAMREYEGGFSTYWETVKNLRELDLDPTEISNLFKGVTDPMEELSELIPDFDLLNFDPVKDSALALADNLNIGLLGAKGLHEVLTEINGMEVSATVRINTVGNIGLGANVLPTGYTDYMPGFASGGSFTVGGSGGTDSQMVSFMATPGEMVNVSTPGQSAGNTIVININSTFAPENEEQFKRMVRPAIVQIFREQEALQ